MVVSDNGGQATAAGPTATRRPHRTRLSCGCLAAIWSSCLVFIADFSHTASASIVFPWRCCCCVDRTLGGTPLHCQVSISGDAVVQRWVDALTAASCWNRNFYTFKECHHGNHPTLSCIRLLMPSLPAEASSRLSPSACDTRSPL